MAMVLTAKPFNSNNRKIMIKTIGKIFPNILPKPLAIPAVKVSIFFVSIRELKCHEESLKPSRFRNDMNDFEISLILSVYFGISFEN